MKLNKTALFGAAIAAVTATSALAFDKLIDHSAKVEIWNAYDSSISGTVPGVRVTANGDSTVYQVGSAPGLTTSIVFDETGEKAEQWARNSLGVTVEALKCGGGGKDSAGGGGGWSFTNC